MTTPLDEKNPDELTYEEKRHLAEGKCRDRVRDIVLDLMDELNKMGNEEEVGKYFVKALQGTHRTLQQNFVRHIIIPSLLDFARRHDLDMYDGRNEASCKLAKKLEPLLKDAGLPFI